MRREQIARLLDHQGVGAGHPQPGQGGARLGLDEVGAAVAAGGLDHHMEGTRARHQLAQHPLGAATDDRVQQPHARAGADLQHVADLLLGRAPARIGDGVVEAKLCAGQAKLCAQIVSAGHGAFGLPHLIVGAP